MAAGPVHRFAHQAMATHFEILIAGAEAEYAGQAARAAFGEIDRLEAMFSRFDVRSDISQINKLRPGQGLLIGVETYECLEVAEQVRSETGGAFDVNVRAWENRAEAEADSEEKSEERPPAFHLLETPAGYQFARPDEEADLPAPKLDLDLGGIGKGYALDAALNVLFEWDIANALLHGGTSTVLAQGAAPEMAEKGGWPVGIGGGWPCLGVPRELILDERALSGSGSEVKGKHILDPRTGKPAQGHVGAWASHPTAAAADALSTAFMVMTEAEVEGFCARHPDTWALVVVDYGRCRAFNFGNL